MKRKAKPKAEPMVKVARSELERWDRLLERAQREAIHAAPRPLPRIGDGRESAIQCFDTLHTVRDSIARAGGSS